MNGLQLSSADCKVRLSGDGELRGLQQRGRRTPDSPAAQATQLADDAVVALTGRRYEEFRLDQSHDACALVLRRDMGPQTNCQDLWINFLGGDQRVMGW